MLAPLMTLLIGVCTAGAQTQEKKVLDRLLRPDTSMVNPAQEKKFAAPAGVSFEKRIPARSFNHREKTRMKPYSGERNLTSPQVAARPFRLGDSPAHLSARAEFAQKDRIINAPPAPGIRVARENNTTAAVREFSGNRPFPGRGKSQRALQAYNRPLTIEQVRELLNKSK